MTSVGPRGIFPSRPLQRFINPSPAVHQLKSIEKRDSAVDGGLPQPNSLTDKQNDASQAPPSDDNGLRPREAGEPESLDTRATAV